MFKQKLKFIPKLVSIVLIFGIVTLGFWPVGAATLTSRSLTLTSSVISVSTTHTFAYTIPASATLGSVKFTYCTTASGACTAPTTLNVDGVAIGTQTGAAADFTVDATETTANVIAIKRPSATAVSGAHSQAFSSAVNPSTDNTSFYVRIQSYQTTTFTTAQDNGVVAASTASAITVTATVDEYLKFCTYVTGGSTTTCGSGSTVALGTLSTSATGSGISLMNAATNAQSGYVITYTGNTLTSGANTITAVSPRATSATNTEQFGFNLRDNATPNIGANVTPTGSGFTGTPVGDYNTVDEYKFVAAGETIANSATSATKEQQYTVAYIANIAGNTEAGAYTTTITYVCTPTF